MQQPQNNTPQQTTLPQATTSSSSSTTMPPQQFGGKKQTRTGRNGKKQHHMTHEAASHRHRNQKGGHQHLAGPILCKICRLDLQEAEKEFFPCNCKYKICQKCFWHHVNNEKGKCPNCGLLFEVNRVRDYYASKAKEGQQQHLQQEANSKKLRCESPQPSVSAPNLIQNLTHSISQQAMGASDSMQHQQQHTLQQQFSSAVATKVANNNQMSMQQLPRGGGKQGGGVKSTNNWVPTMNSTITKGSQATQQQQQQRDINTLKQSQRSYRTQGAADASTGGDHLSATAKTSGGGITVTGGNSKQLVVAPGCGKKQRNSSEQQRFQQKLSQVRILQRNTLYVIGLSPNVAKEDTLRRYEYFSQYGRIQSITINKEKAFQSENQGLCFSAYINYASEREASLAILAVDQFVFDGRLLHASYGRTKYCRFFLKGTNCLNHECPYLHKEAHPENILTQEDMNKKILFQQCQQLALKLSKLSKMTEEQFRGSLRAHKETMIRSVKLSHTSRIIMPQLEPVYEKKGLFKHCISTISSNVISEAQGQPQLAVPQQLQSQQQTTMSCQTQLFQGIAANPNTGARQLPNKSAVVGNNRPSIDQQTAVGVANTPDLAAQKSSAFKHHRGSEGCHSEVQSSHYNMMMFGGRGRLQSSGTHGELDFQTVASGGQQARWQQLVSYGGPVNQNQNRRFAQDDHYLTRMPPAFRLTAGNTTNQGGGVERHQTNASMTLANQNNFGQLPQQSQQRFGSPHPPQSQVYFGQQFLPPMSQQQQLNKTGSATQFLPMQLNLRDSDKATQQSSSYRAQHQSLHQLSQAYQQHQYSFQQASQAQADGRARSGSLVAAVTASKNQFDGAQMQQPQRRTSHDKFRAHDHHGGETANGDGSNKEEQRQFTEVLRQKLTQAMQGGENDQRYTQEGESTDQFSSIFAGDHRLGNKMMFSNQNVNCSEGVAARHACSPIRDSILQSRRGSGDYGALGRPRSQHSLIVESVARILDDTALEQRGDRERRMMQMLNEPNFKTGPPSEVHQLMHEKETMALNSHFQTEIEAKWNNQFDINSSNSLNLTNPGAAMASKQALQKSTGERNMSNQNTFTSPGGPNSAAQNMNSSLYNSPFFLIPTHTSNQQHRSAAFHDNSLRHLNSHANAFSLGGNSNTQYGGAARSGMVNDTWRLTYNPHPLLPRGPPGATQSSNLSSAGGVFRNTTKSDHEYGMPMLSRTTSQPFMMRTEQKVRNQAQQQGKLNSSQQLSQYAQLTQRNLEILNKKYCPSKDMLYAKIFTDFRPSSPAMRNNNQGSSFGAGVGAPQHPISMQHQITPQSLFCFALDGDDSINDLRQSKLRNLKLQKQVSRDDAADLLSTPTRRKEPYFFGQGNLDNNVKETSQTPTNKHSRGIWHQYSAGDNLSQKRQTNSGKLPNEKKETITSDEIEMANHLANEASLGFGDLFSAMQSKSKKSQNGGGTQMSVVDGDPQPQRSRSQSYRENPATAADGGQQQTIHRYSSGGIFEEQKNKLRQQRAASNEVSSGQQSPRSDNSSSHAEKRNLAVTGQQQTSQGQSAATATTTGGPKNFYQEFVKVQEGFRKSSGLISSKTIAATKVETRRSSYSQGRNSSAKAGIQLMEVTKRNNFKRGSHLRRSMIISPLGLLKFKNHQIDEVNEDGATARDEKIDGEETRSLRMNSADRQSYNLKTLKSVSRSRKASHSQNEGGRRGPSSQGQ